jgi:hypothetical protein
VNSRIAYLRSLVREKRFDDALSILCGISDHEMTEELWILRGLCIQLSDGTDLPLAEAKRSFECALHLNPKHADATLEMAWFLLNVEDDAKAAEPFFVNALGMISEIQESALRGCAQCKVELESTEAAVEFLRTFPTNQGIKDKLLLEL